MDVTKITRQEAFEANIEFRMGVRDKILMTMIIFDDKPWTASSLCKLLGLKYTSVHPRLCDLKAEGKIEAVGITRQYGIKEAIYRLGKEGSNA